MTMSKLFKRMILMVSMLGVMLFSMTGTSSAEDVWCYSSNGFSYYLSSDSIRKVDYSNGIMYTVDGKTVLESNGSLGRPLMYGFSIENDYVIGHTFDRAYGSWYYISDKDGRAEAKSVWNAMKPYMRQKGISFGESWE